MYDRPIPLRNPDPDVLTDLGEVFAVAYERGRYDNVIDYESPGTAHYRQIVGLFPRRGSRTYSPTELAVMLDLPPGTLTQRTMIYAVRTHPEAPCSALGLPQ